MACVKVELSRQNRKAGVTLFAMNKITQDIQFKQVVAAQFEQSVCAVSETVACFYRS